MSAELEHWKRNHAMMVARCAILSQRPDLPVDRLPAMHELARVQRENESLRNTLEMLNMAITANMPRDMIERINQEAQRLIGLK